MTNFDDVISFANLYKAHRRARLGKRHKKEVILFEANLSQNLWKLHYDLKYNKYEMSGYHHFTIYEPKQREIQAICYTDRIVQHSLCDNFLIPLFERRLIYDNCACRRGKGTSFAVKRLKEFMAKHYKLHGLSGYFVKVDVRKYFDSINHNVLKQKLNGVIMDERVKNLAFYFIDSYNGDSGKGLPMGNQSSQCFGLYYLDELDRFFKEKMKVKFYLRYMDDILMIVSSKAMAKNCLKHAEILLNKNLLDINPKSQIMHIKNGVEFLGWRFSLTINGNIKQKIKRATAKRVVGKLKHIHFLCVHNRKQIEYIERAIVSYKGLLSIGGCSVAPCIEKSVKFAL